MSETPNLSESECSGVVTGFSAVDGLHAWMSKDGVELLVNGGFGGAALVYAVGTFVVGKLIEDGYGSREFDGTFLARWRLNNSARRFEPAQRVLSLVNLTTVFLLITGVVAIISSLVGHWLASLVSAFVALLSLVCGVWVIVQSNRTMSELLQWRNERARATAEAEDQRLAQQDLNELDRQ
jgi:hypothetical protein